jgi:hypothetical protein
VEALVGFELEVFPITLHLKSNRSEVLPAGSVLFTAPSGLWNLTTDVFVRDELVVNDLEVVTAAFPTLTDGGDRYFNQVFLSCLLYDSIILITRVKALLEIEDFIFQIHLEMERVRDDVNVVSEMSLPDYVSGDLYTLLWDKNDAPDLTIHPQATFALAPHKYYSLVCDGLTDLTHTSILYTLAKRAGFIDAHSSHSYRVLCSNVKQFFESSRFQQVVFCTTFFEKLQLTLN